MYKKWWKTILKLMITAIFFTAVFSFLMPKSYLSKVTLISVDSGASATSNIGKLLGISSISLGASSNDIIVAMIESKRMEKDINNLIALNNNPNFKYTISTKTIKAGLIIEVKGGDPALTEKIANFTVQNLDKINGELNITPNKPMVKVLDPAVYGLPASRKILQKIFIAAFSVFLILSFYIFLVSYFRKNNLP